MQKKKTEYYKVIGPSGKEVGAFEFNDEDHSFAQRIETLELLRSNQYKAITINQDQYNKIDKKFAV